MPNQKSRLTLAVVLIAATVLAAGGAAVASNTGFKINKALFPTSTASANKGNNWTAMPYFNPYPNGNVLCLAMGLRTAGVGGVTITTAATLTRIDPITGAAPSGICGTTAGTFTWPAGLGVRIRNTTAATGPVAPSSAILVGSHNPSISLNIPPTDAANANKGTFWFSVPYHTTNVNGQDLCNSIGLVSTGNATTRGALLRANADTGSPQNGVCGSTASGIALVLGEAIRVRQPGLPPAGLTFVPAHF